MINTGELERWGTVVNSVYLCNAFYSTHSVKGVSEK